MYYSCPFPVTGKRRYPAPVIAVSNSAPEELGADSVVVPKRAEPKRRHALPDDLLSRSEEEGARRLALKALSAARAAERRLDDRSDPEALHDFRVAIRRLRSLLRAYKPQLESSIRKKESSAPSGAPAGHRWRPGGRRRSRMADETAARSGARAPHRAQLALRHPARP